MNTLHFNAYKNIRGFMLLEVLVSVLIFAFGVVALMGLQARAMGTSTESNVRAEAMYLARSYVGEMWAAGVGDVQGAEAAFRENGAFHQKMHNRLIADLPGAQDAAPGNKSNPEVVIESAAGLADNAVRVLITIYWVEPSAQNPDGSPVVHSYTEESFIGSNVKPGAASDPDDNNP
ncbi:MAG: hypothetical protein LBG61_00850 [Burkholderiales bacterium]|jgi:type IV pilus assembly protein PilV|nr:hypothetical protein [Burkholderiales bacterium]